MQIHGAMLRIGGNEQNRYTKDIIYLLVNKQNSVHMKMTQTPEHELET